MSVWAAPVARASVVRSLSLEELVRMCDFVVLVRPYKQEGRWFGRSNLIVTDVSLQVEMVLKGDVRVSETIVVTVLGGRIGTLAMQVPGEAIFVLNQPVVAFLVRGPKHGVRVAGMSQGVLPVIEENNELVVAPGGAGAVLVERGSDGVRNADPKPMPRLLTDLVARVRELVPIDGNRAP